jgi:hypothetical protein
VIGVFNNWNVLMYVARARDTDEEAIQAAKKRGIVLPETVVVRRPGEKPRVYQVDSVTGEITMVCEHR